MKKSYKHNEFEISGPTWDEEFELPNGSYFVLDVQSYFDYVVKKHETLTDSPPIQIYVNRIENGINYELRLDTILRFPCLKILSYLVAVKKRSPNTRMVRMFHDWKSLKYGYSNAILLIMHVCMTQEFCIYSHPIDQIWEFGPFFTHLTFIFLETVNTC